MNNQEILFGSETEKRVRLQTADQVVHVVPRAWMEMAGLIKDMIEDEDGDSNEVIPLPNIEESETLKKVISYCEYHHKEKAVEIEKPLKDFKDSVCDWDFNFVNVEFEPTLKKMMMAANYINCKDMLDLCCAKVATMIKGKSPEEIRALFDIVNDFTPEEEEKIREENKWVEEH